MGISDGVVTALESSISAALNAASKTDHKDNLPELLDAISTGLQADAKRLRGGVAAPQSAEWMESEFPFAVKETVDKFHAATNFSLAAAENACFRPTAVNLEALQTAIDGTLTRVLGAIVKHLKTGSAYKKLLDHMHFPESFVDVVVAEACDTQKLHPALRNFSPLCEVPCVVAVLGDASADEGTRERETAVEANTIECDLVRNPDCAHCGSALRAQAERLRTAYSAAIDERMALPKLFEVAADAVVAGGDTFSSIYMSVWRLIDNGLGEDDDTEGCHEYQRAVVECLEGHPARPLDASVSQRLANPKDVGALMVNAARVVAPFGAAVSAVLEHAEKEHGFRCVDRKKPTRLKKLHRIIEKSVLRHAKDASVDSIGDVVRMMAIVTTMAHVAKLLRTLSDERGAVAHVLRALPPAEDGSTVESLRLVRAKDRYYRAPSSGGWRDLMLNLRVTVRTVEGVELSHVGEV